MKIDIYVAVDGTRQCWDEPKLVTKSGFTSLPTPPPKRHWRFFISTTSDDKLKTDQPFDVLSAFGPEQYFLFNWD